MVGEFNFVIGQLEVGDPGRWPIRLQENCKGELEVGAEGVGQSDCRKSVTIF